MYSLSRTVVNADSKTAKHKTARYYRKGWPNKTTDDGRRRLRLLFVTEQNVTLQTCA